MKTTKNWATSLLAVAMLATIGLFVIPATAAHATSDFLIVTTSTTTPTAGVPFDVTVTATTTGNPNNVDLNYGGTVTLSPEIADLRAVVPESYTYTTGTGGDDGVHTFSVTLITAQETSILAKDNIPGDPQAESTEITVSPGPTTQLALESNAITSSNYGVGVPFYLQVTAEDQYGNITPNYTGTVHLVSTDPHAVLPSDENFTGQQGLFEFSPLEFETSGSQSVTATDTAPNSTIEGTTGSIEVLPGGTTQLAISTIANQTSGSSFSVYVTPEDQFGNPTPNFEDTLHFTLENADNDQGTIVPSDQAYDTNHPTEPFEFLLNKAQSQKVTVSDITAFNTVNSGTSNSFTVNPGATKKLLISTPASPQTAGSAFNVTVTAEDAAGNPTPAFTDTVQFALGETDQAGDTVPGNQAFHANGSGQETFSFTLDKAQSGQTITVTDFTDAFGVTGATTGNFTVSPSSGAKLLISTVANQTAGAGFTVTVTAEDGEGNLIPTFADSVQFSLGESDTDTGTVIPTTPTSTVSGQETFSFTLDKAQSGQTITVSDTTNTGVTSAATADFTVSPAATSKFLVVGPSPAQTAGSAFAFSVTAEDAYGNTTPAYAGTVHFSSSDTSSHVVLPSSYTFTGADNGVHTFGTGSSPVVGGATLYTAGSDTITATDTVTSSIHGTTTPGITVDAPTVTLSGPDLVNLPIDGTATATFTLTVHGAGGTPLSYFPATVFTAELSCVGPAQVSCTIPGANGSLVSVSSASPTVTVDISESGDYYFTPGNISLTLVSASSGDYALPNTLAVTPTVTSTGAQLAINAAATVPAGQTLSYPVSLLYGTTPVTALDAINFTDTIALCPLPSYLTCTTSGTATIAAGATGTTIPVATSATANVYFSPQVVTDRLTSVSDAGLNLAVPEYATGTVTTTAATPTVTITGTSTVQVPAQQGEHTYTVTLSGQVATPVTVTYTVTGDQTKASQATPGVDYTTPTGTTTGTVTFTPPNPGTTLDPTTATFSIDYLTRAIHGPNRYLLIALGAGTGYQVTPSPAKNISVLIDDTKSDGYWVLSSDGGVFNYGTAGFHGSAYGDISPKSVAERLAPTPTGKGYWIVAADGSVFSFGDAHFHGSAYNPTLYTGGANPYISGIAATPSGKGYWLVASDGGVFAYGDAHFYGSMYGRGLVGKIVGIQATRSGHGYYLVGSDGGVFAFGDATFRGSLEYPARPPSNPILGITVDPSGDGYWLAAQNGGVFAFGDAHFYGNGNTPGTASNYDSIVSNLPGTGYWLLNGNGKVTPIPKGLGLAQTIPVTGNSVPIWIAGD